MLANIWLLFMVNILKVFIWALPDYSGMPTEVTTAINSIKGGINAIGFVLPFDTLFQIVAIILTIEGAIFAFVWSNWLFNKLRGSG